MALFAVEIAVCALQFEFGLIVVIENPDTPAVRVMTLLAVGSQGSFMFVILFVTGIAFGFGILVSRREMAFLAGGGCMQAE